MDRDRVRTDEEWLGYLSRLFDGTRVTLGEAADKLTPVVDEILSAIDSARREVAEKCLEFATDPDALCANDIAQAIRNTLIVKPSPSQAGCEHKWMPSYFSRFVCVKCHERTEQANP